MSYAQQQQDSQQTRNDGDIRTWQVQLHGIWVNLSIAPAIALFVSGSINVAIRPAIELPRLAIPPALKVVYNIICCEIIAIIPLHAFTNVQCIDCRI